MHLDGRPQDLLHCCMLSIRPQAERGAGTDHTRPETHFLTRFRVYVPDISDTIKRERDTIPLQLAHSERGQATPACVATALHRAAALRLAARPRSRDDAELAQLLADVTRRAGVSAAQVPRGHYILSGKGV